MHRVVRPPIAFIPRQRHVAEGGCTTWGHRTAASAKCSCVRMQACCTRCNRQRMLAVAVPRTAKHCSGNEALQGWCAALAGMSVCSWLRMQACCSESYRLRMQAAAVEAKAWLRKRSPSRRSEALGAERNAAACKRRLAAAKATGCECRRLQTVAVIRAAKHCSDNEARQGWCVALAGMSGCSCVRMQAVAVIRSAKQSCANGALQGGVQR